MKNREAKELLIGAKELGNLTGFAFVMAIADAKSRIRKEQEVLDAMVKPSKEFETYQEELRQSSKDHSRKDEDGNPKTKTKENELGQIYVDEKGVPFQFFDIDPDKEAAHKKETKKLEKKNKLLIDEQTAKQKKYNDAMEEESTLELKEISEKQLPKNITLEQLEIASQLITIKKKES
jgi:hypothetical protein